MPEELNTPRSPVDVIPDGVDKLEHIKTKRAYMFTPEHMSKRTQEQLDKEIADCIKCTRWQSEQDAIYEKYPDTPDWSAWMHKHI